MGLIVYPVTYVDGSPLPATNLTQNFTAITNQMNGSIENVNISATAAIALSKLDLTSPAFNKQATGNLTWASGITGDGNPRVTMDSDGNLRFGAGGGSATDIGWQRSAANTMRPYVPGGGTPVLNLSGVTVSNIGTISVGALTCTSLSVGSLAGVLFGTAGAVSALSLTANYVMLGNGTGAPQMVAPGSNGNVLTSNGTTWVSSASAASGFTVSAKSGSFSASDGPSYYYRNSATGTITMPASPADGSVRKFKQTGGVGTFAFDGAETINHANGISDQILSLDPASGVLELVAVTGGWDET